MQISPIINYNQQININNQPKQRRNNPSFGNIKVPNLDLKYYFSSSNYAEKFVEEVSKLQKEKLNLREIVDTSKLSQTGKTVFKNLISQLTEEAIQDYPIQLDLMQDGYYNYYFANLYEELFSDSCIDSAYQDTPSSKRIRIETGKHMPIYLHTNIEFIKTQLENHIIEACEKKAKEIEKNAAEEKENKHFADLQNLLEAEPEKIDVVKAIEVPTEDLLPVDSVVCTLDDINNYFIEHLAEVGEGRIFNKPVTKDGESLLIALAHVQPDKDNIDAYIRLVKSMIKMPFIDYNQKDTMNVPFIAHVLNSQNKVLFAAVTGCKNLRYEPSLEFEFNSITDPEFKELVLKTPIFENEENSKFKTVFGKPNPVYKEPSLIDVAGIG